MILGTVDLGTNAFRLLLFDKKKMKVIKRFSGIVGLGSYINKNKILKPPKAYYETLDQIFFFIKSFKVDKVMVVGTSVFRDCKNQKEIKENFYKRYNYKLNIISSFRESSLSSKGALIPLNLKKKNTIVVDIGGGSTEVSFIRDRKILDYVSMRLGVVRELNKYKNNINSEELINKIFKDIEKKILKYKFFQRFNENRFDIVMNGGTPTTLTAIKLKMKKYDRNLVNGYMLSTGYTKLMLNRLLSLSPNQRLKIHGMEKGREVVIIYGVIILLSILKILKKKNYYVSDSGILEGLLQEID